MRMGGDSHSMAMSTPTDILLGIRSTHTRNHAEISHLAVFREKRWHDEAWGGNSSRVGPEHCHNSRPREEEALSQFTSS